MENTGIATYIERIEIEGLWGRFDVDWKLNLDVNILVGKNGTGKTTILQAIKDLEELTSLINESQIFQVPSPGLPFGKFIISFNDSPNTKFEVTYEPSFTYSETRNRPLSPKWVTYTISGHFSVLVSFIKTFEVSLLIRDDFEKEKKPGIKTSLDKMLDNLIDLYVDYQLNQSQKALRNEISIDQAFAKRTYFIETLNRLFADSGKIVDEKQNRISFLIGDKPISAYQLSSGEKQLLILLLTVLTQDEKPSVLLLDEPESSLHLDWQYELINILRTLNPNCQLIIVTHSPSIFTDGHKPKVFWIEDILHPTKQALAIAK